jgi:hypothetical protein
MDADRSSVLLSTLIPFGAENMHLLSLIATMMKLNEVEPTVLYDGLSCGASRTAHPTYLDVLINLHANCGRIVLLHLPRSTSLQGFLHL